MIDKGPAQAPPSEEQLITALKGPLKSLLSEEIEGDTDPDKVVQYARARFNTLLWKNIQFVAPVMGNNGIADYQQVGGNGQTGNNYGAAGSFDYTQNDFRGFGLKYCAVVGQRAPNVKARADDPNNEESVNSTRTADDVNAILNSWWDIDNASVMVAYYNYTTGPSFLYTPYVADGDKYGWREEPNYDTQSQPMGDPYHHCMNCGTDSPQPENGSCPQCQKPMGPESQMDPESVDVPTQSGTTKYPNGRVQCIITDCTTTTTPFPVQKMEDCPWLKYSLEENKGILLTAYPQLRGKNLDNQGDSAQSNQGRMARDAAISPTGGPLRHNNSRWLHDRIWIQKNQYSLVKEDSTKKLLTDNYPDGLKITQVQGEVVKLENECLHKLWAVVKPQVGPTINSDGVGQDMVSEQLLKNHMLNIAAETFERGIPQTLYDPRVFNGKAWGSRRASPAEMIPTLPNSVTDSLEDAFFQLPPAQFSAQQEPWMASVMQGAMTNVGITPAIFGGGDASTARAAEINKNAAMMQLGLNWMFNRKGWESAKYNAVLQLAKYGSGIVQGGSKMVDLSNLTTTGWHFEADEAIPSTWGQRRDLLQFFMEKPPAILEAFGFTSPSNIMESAALLGMPVGWETPGVADIQKVEATIKKLLQAAPIQKPNQDGSTDIQPSIPIDDFEDNHTLVAKYIQEWAQGASLPGQVRETNPNGYANVIAYGTASQKAANPPPPPPPTPEPKLSISGKLEDMPPEAAQEILKQFNINTNLAAMGSMMQGKIPQNMPISAQADVAKQQLAPPPVVTPKPNGAPAPGGSPQGLPIQ